MKWFLFLVSFSLCCIHFPLFCAESFYLSLTGHLDKETVKNAIEQIQSKNPSQLAIKINSSSGSLSDVFEFCKTVYQRKQTKKLNVVVFIDDTAIGPSAMIPFLADEIVGSYFLSWGDIPQGTDQEFSTNLLRNRVLSLISDPHPRGAILSLLASAMIDQNLRIIENGGWRIDYGEEDKNAKVRSQKGETLIVSQRDLKSLGLIKEEMTLEEFEKQYGGVSPQPTKNAIPKEGPTATGIDAKLAKHILYKPNEKNLIGKIIIDDRTTGINQSTWIYVKSAIDYYKKKKPAFVILELNTPGGEVFAAQRISNALKELDTQENIPVITFINNWAISAGAMLAYSTRFITLVKDASMGAAEPVIPTQEGMKTASEKVNSALRADFANRARFFGRNPLLAEAMVDKDLVLVFRHGEVVRLDSDDQIRRSGPNRDDVITTKGKLLTFDAEEMMKYYVGDILLQPKKLDPISAKEKEKGQWPANKELLFEYPFFQQIPNAMVDVYQMDWKTRFFTWLAHPVVASILFLGMMLGFYVEMNTPGFGVPGSIALICLFMIVLSSFALEAVHWLELILFLGGLVLLGIDLFLIPSFGLMGTAGIVFMIVGLFGMMIPGLEAVDFEFDTQTFNAAGEYAMNRLAWLFGTILVGLIVIVVLARYALPRFRPFQRFILAGSEEDASKGFFAGERPEDLPSPGKLGEVVATLRPTGKILIEDKIYDAVASGEFIESGAEIEVDKVDGNVIVVKRRLEGEK